MIKMTGGNKIILETERRCKGDGELQQAGVTGGVCMSYKKVEKNQVKKFYF